MVQTAPSDLRAKFRQGRSQASGTSANSRRRPKLYLIDHSLTKIGGHHFDSARLLLHAAADLGYEPVLATNRRLRCRDGLPADWKILPLFRHTVYTQASATAGSALFPSNPLRESPADEGKSWWSKLNGRWTRYQQRRRVQSFAAACGQVFRQVPPTLGDQVFLPTLSEFDLVGLAEFLRLSEDAACCDWHLQFHYQFLKGPVSSCGQQSERQDAMRIHFSEVAERAGKVHWNFYAPTSGLVEQYSGLGVVPFQLLEHPVGSNIVPLVAENPSRQAGSAPLRALCAGGLRSDKGSPQLRELLADLERDDFADGAIQLWIQAKSPGKMKAAVGKQQFVTADPNGLSPPNHVRLVHVPHPLPSEAYSRLLRNADVGLLAYDPHIYAVRCSGVLVELLAAGIPVVVPENTWLADELLTAGVPAPGLIAKGPAGFAASLRELAKNRSEYQQRAREAAPQYAHRHSARAVIEQLQSNARAQVAA